jgi:hypothetical protein
MTKGTHRYKTGLIFNGPQEIDCVAVINRIGMTLEARQVRITGKHVLSDTEAQILARNIEVTIGTEECAAQDGDDAVRLTVSVTAHDCDCADDNDAALRLLASVTLDLVQHLVPDSLWWLTPKAQLSRAQFLSAAGPRRPRRVRHARTRRASARPSRAEYAQRHASDSNHATPFPTVEESLDALDARMAEHLAPRDEQAHADPDPSDHNLREVFLSDNVQAKTEDSTAPAQPSAPERLTAWILAITVGVFSLPVAASLVVINLFRGEDLRLSAQALSLTGLFVALSSRGMLAPALALIPTLS